MNIVSWLKVALVAAIYVVIVYVFYVSSFESIQLRIAEVLMFLCFFKKRYIISCTIGCFIVNLIGPYGIIDALVGSFATLCAGILMHYVSKKLIISSIWPVVVNAIFVSLMITLTSVDNFNFEIIAPIFLLNAGFIALGEFIVICIIGLPLFYFLQKHKWFNEMVLDEK